MNETSLLCADVTVATKTPSSIFRRLHLKTEHNNNVQLHTQTENAMRERTET